MIDATTFRLGVVRGISFGLFGPPLPFSASARALGASVVRVFLYWSQVEPKPGAFDWRVVDALLDQRGSEELWVTVCSSSKWATVQATDFLPPSPARELAQYRRFVHALVEHCGGRVRYWQCDNEPSNVGLTWLGSAEAYARQVIAFSEAVRAADAAAAVVLGGCGYDALSSAPDGAPRMFFDAVLARTRDAFDLCEAADVRPRNRFHYPPAVPQALLGAERDAALYRSDQPAARAHAQQAALRANAVAIYIDAAGDDALNAHDGAEFLHRTLWQLDVAHEYRLRRDSDHAGPDMAERLREAFAWVAARLQPTAAAPLSELELAWQRFLEDGSAPQPTTAPPAASPLFTRWLRAQLAPQRTAAAAHDPTLTRRYGLL